MTTSSDQNQGTIELLGTGNFTLNSGVSSKFKIDCDALSDHSILTGAGLIRAMIGSYTEVYGVPTGGKRLEQALKPFVGISGPILIVDDVLTTGGSMERLRSQLGKEKGLNMSKLDDYFIGAVLFARGCCPPWIESVFQMPRCFWPGTPKVVRRDNDYD